LASLAALLAVGIGISILISQILRMRQVAKLKKRFAADLHDELGANLHAIGILGTHAKDILDSPEQLEKTVDQIYELTKRTGEATRYCSTMQTTKEAHENLEKDMQRTARRIIANLKYSFIVEGAEIINSLKPRSRSDLFLFFKESLVNINRHADATQVYIELIATPQQIKLTISDNGCGIPSIKERTIPPSLQRRAKLLGAEVIVGPSDEGGTSITLRLRPRWGLRRKNWGIEKYKK
jgi:signal transduction histidine kinase